MAMTRPQPLADHTSIIKRTAENFPKTALASIQLMCLIAKTNQVIYTSDLFLGCVDRPCRVFQLSNWQGNKTLWHCLTLLGPNGNIRHKIKIIALKLNWYLLNPSENDCSNLQNDFSAICLCCEFCLILTNWWKLVLKLNAFLSSGTS